MTENERIVTDFCNAWSRLDADELTDYFTPDGVYHNIPWAPLRGQEEIRERLKSLPQRIKEFRIEILYQVSSGNVVMNERMDYIGPRSWDRPLGSMSPKKNERLTPNKG